MNITLDKIENPILEKWASETFDFTENYLCIIQPFQQILQKKYLKHHDCIQNFEVFEDDVWITTFPKSGIFLWLL